MKKSILAIIVVCMCSTNLSLYAQTEKDTTLLGLPGDNLDLYAVLDLFLKSKTIEDFEKSLNEQKSGINNLDLDLDKKVDFIKVVTTKKDDSYTFVLQVAVSKTETQDVAVILVDRDKNKKVTVQMVGDKELYGKDYIIEPKKTSTPAVTANPAYTGTEPPVKTVPAQTAIVVETVPIVQYVYSPAYVPYVPPYYYGYYPPYFAAFTAVAVGIYRANNFYYHGGGYGYHNTVIINNGNHYNHYNNSRNTSNRVQHHNANGNYGNRNTASTRPSTGGPSASTRPSTGGPSASTRPSNNGPSASTRPSNNGPSASTRPSNNGVSASRSNYSNSGRSRSGGGGGFGGGGGGGSRGGGGRRR
jgi:uncharacterized membrane protein YgcG